MKTTTQEFIDVELEKFNWMTSDETKNAISKLAIERGGAVLKKYEINGGSLEIPDNEVGLIQENIRNIIKQAAIDGTSIRSFDN